MRSGQLPIPGLEITSPSSRRTKHKRRAHHPSIHYEERISNLEARVVLLEGENAWLLVQLKGVNGVDDHAP